MFVYLWLLFYLVAFLLRAFRPEFAMPEELGRVALQVLGIFFGSRASKYLWEARGRTVAEAKLPERGEQVLELIRTRGRITNHGVADALQVSSASAKRILTDLSARSQIQAKEVGRGTFYTMPDGDQLSKQL